MRAGGHCAIDAAPMGMAVRRSTPAPLIPADDLFVIAVNDLFVIPASAPFVIPAIFKPESMYFGAFLDPGWKIAGVTRWLYADFPRKPVSGSDPGKCSG